MAKKKDKKGTSFLQTTYDIATAGVTVDKPTGGSNIFNEAYAAAGGGQYGNPGAGNVGYTVDWSKVDFGKAALEKKMNSLDQPTKQQMCARKGGVWNAEKGICEKKKEEETNITREECEKKAGYAWNIEKNVCEKMDETPTGPTRIECGCSTPENPVYGMTQDECNDKCKDEKPRPKGDVKCPCSTPEKPVWAKSMEACNQVCKDINPDDDKCPNPDEYWDEQQGKCVKKSTTNVPDKKDVPGSELNLGNQQGRNDFNKNVLKPNLSKQQQEDYNASYRQNNVNPDIEGLNVKTNDNLSIYFGGGDIDRGEERNLMGKKTGKIKNPIKAEFDNDGNMTGFRNEGNVKGDSFNYSFDFVTRDGLTKIQFKALRKPDRKVFEEFTGINNFDSNGKLNASQWENFREKYNEALEGAQALLKEATDKHSGDAQSIRNYFVSQAYAKTGVSGFILSQVLKMNARGMFNGGFSDEDTPANFKSQFDYTQPIPVQFKSPFASRSAFRSRLKTRENWMPQQAAPMNYGSPLHQQEQDVSQMQFGSIWEKIQAYGPDMNKKIDKFIKHTNYNAETDKPINSFQNQEWVGIITKWLQEQKAAMIRANKNNDEKQRISTAVNTLIQDVTTYSGKFLDWIARNAGDETEGNAGGSVVSQGSRKDERFIGNITFMGDKNTTIAIGEDGKIGIKSFGLPTVKYVEELDTDVFAKDDMGYAQFLKISEELQKLAESGKPLNENTVKGNADQLLKNEDSILSWAFDPLYGQSWLQDYLEVDPGVDVDQFMPESPKFDLDRLTDEIHGWLTSKMKEAYNQNVPQQPEQKGDAAQAIMDQTLASVDEEKQNKEGVYAEKTEQQETPPEAEMALGPPQGPPQQDSPMAYLSKTRKKLEKFKNL